MYPSFAWKLYLYLNASALHIACPVPSGVCDLIIIAAIAGQQTVQVGGWASQLCSDTL